MKNKSLWIFIILLLIIFKSYNYINSHIGEIYGSFADYNYKKNNIYKAQEFYEKAFEHGLKNPKQREIYVNSIINSPLTTEAQEKLVKIVQNSKYDIAKVKAQYFISDLKREIHNKYPDNYIKNAVFNQKILRWGNLPITYSFENPDDAPSYFTQEIEEAFTEWEKATEHQLLFSNEKNNANIIIKFDKNNPANDVSQKYVVAYTTPNLHLNKLETMEIVFYLKDPMGNNFSKTQVYNTALHEIAHAIGFMGHCNNKENIMYLTKDSKSELNDIRETLTQADINTIKLLYKIKPQITNIKNNKAEYIPFLVLGTEEEVHNEKLNEAKIYIKKAPHLPAGYIDLAEGYVVAKDYMKAARSLEKALKLAQTDEEYCIIYFNLAVTNFYLDNLEKAQEYLIKSMKIKDSEEKHYLLGEIYVRNGETKKAIQEYSALIKNNPQNIEYTVALTNIYIINRDFINARKILKNYFKTKPSDRNNPRFQPYGIITFGL